MSSPIITIEHLSKRYIIGHQHNRHDGLRHRIEGAARAPWRWAKNLWQYRSANSNLQSSSSGLPSPMSHLPSSRATREEFWALKDVSFEVKQGEVVGIIGRNGAGKSTLLKILSRITEPTEGRVRIKGRVASLLEVGTGFHPELTGRENIFLNGAILGMSKAEIKRKFDEIVAFSEIEKFLDTPVKRYSSGMYVRLAFAVAAHLEPEILIVDEVLAVGDAQFQKKCLDKMDDEARAGRTVILVTHTMPTVEALCDRAILLAGGSVFMIGKTSQVVGNYLGSGDQVASQSILSEHPGRQNGATPLMTAVELVSESGALSSSFPMGSSISVSVRFRAEANPLQPVLGVQVKDDRGVAVLGVNNRFIPGYEFRERVGFGCIICHLERIPLMPGRYYIDLYFGDAHKDHDIVHEAIYFEVVPQDVFRSGKLPPAGAGPIFWPAKWTLRAG
jgi:lipopolysaccharide transport system ATP-binding protein